MSDSKDSQKNIINLNNIAKGRGQVSTNYDLLNNIKLNIGNVKQANNSENDENVIISSLQEIIKSNNNKDKAEFNDSETDYALEFLISDFVKVKNDKFILNPNHKEYSTEELNNFLNNFQYQEIPGFHNLAYIIKNKKTGEDTLVLTDKISIADFVKLDKALSSINVKPKKVIGFDDKIMTYRELINPEIRIIRARENNLPLHVFLIAHFDEINSIYNNPNASRYMKIRNYLKKRQMKKDMGIHNDKDHELDKEEEEVSYHLTQGQKMVLKMDEETRIKTMKNSILNNLKKLHLSDETVKDIKLNLNSNKYDSILAYSLDSKEAVHRIAVKELNAKEHFQQLINSYKANNNLMYSMKNNYV